MNVVRIRSLDRKASISPIPNCACNILLAEDCCELRKMFECFFEMWGYSYISVGDGIEALKQISQASIRIIVSDYQMPGKTGLEILKEVRDKQLNIEVIIISADHSPGLVDQAIHLGAFACITKPFEPNQLKIVMDNAWHASHCQSKQHNAGAASL